MANLNDTNEFEKIVIEDDKLGFVLNQLQENIEKAMRPLNLVISQLSIEEVLEAERLAREAASEVAAALAAAQAALAAISALTTQIDAATAAANAATAAVALLQTAVDNLTTQVNAFQGQIDANTAHRQMVSGNPHVVTKTDVGLSNVPNTDFTTPVANNTANVAQHELDIMALESETATNRMANLANTAQLAINTPAIVTNTTNIATNTTNIALRKVTDASVSMDESTLTINKTDGDITFVGGSDLLVNGEPTETLIIETDNGITLVQNTTTSEIGLRPASTTEAGTQSAADKTKEDQYPEASLANAGNVPVVLADGSAFGLASVAALAGTANNIRCYRFSGQINEYIGDQIVTVLNEFSFSRVDNTNNSYVTGVITLDNAAGLPVRRFNNDTQAYTSGFIGKV